MNRHLIWKLKLMIENQRRIGGSEGSRRLMGRFAPPLNGWGPTIGEFFFAMIGRVGIGGSKSDVAINVTTCLCLGFHIIYVGGDTQMGIDLGRVGGGVRWTNYETVN